VRWQSHPGPAAGRTAVRVTALALVATAAVACGDGGGSGGDSGTSSGTTASAPSGTSSATPSPSRSYALSSAPTTIPSVRTHEAARGPGWKPAAGSAVVIAAGSAGSGLADEGRLLSTELKIAYRGASAARAGDVELALAKGGAAESYTLTARDGRVLITGPDQSGVFYGTRTLKQSLRADGTVPEGVVRDRPEWPQRGLNLDIARKSYTAGWIEDRLREMADLKLNQLGLHFSDDQGFRIESRTHPEIVSQEHLTQAEVRQILALASRLHITVVPEIDSPGHLGAVIDAHPDLQLRNAQGVATKGAIDISNPASARIVDDLDREFGKLFPGKYWHLGADEYQALVVSDPQTSYPKLAALARAQFGASAKVQDLTTAWTNNRAKVVRAIGKKPKVWNDGLFADGVVAADKDLQVEYWTGTESGVRRPQAYLSEGRQVVNLNDKYLYYVLGQPNQFRYPTGELIYDDWTPLVLRGTTAVPERYSKQIQGGRLAIWGDFPNAQTQDQVAQGIRMPLRAVAQKLWAPGKPRLTWSQFTALAGRLGG
jgi:hexosaminidase